MLLLDRRQWLDVLHWVMWINSWHDRLYYRLIHGDKVQVAVLHALSGLDKLVFVLCRRV